MTLISLSDLRASDDLENPDQLRTLLKDLREARQAKSREGLKHLDHSELGVSPSPTSESCEALANFDAPAYWPRINGNQRDSTILRRIHDRPDKTRTKARWKFMIL